MPDDAAVLEQLNRLQSLHCCNSVLRNTLCTKKSQNQIITLHKVIGNIKPREKKSSKTLKQNKNKAEIRLSFTQTPDHTIHRLEKDTKLHLQKSQSNATLKWRPEKHVLLTPPPRNSTLHHYNHHLIIPRACASIPTSDLTLHPDPNSPNPTKPGNILWRSWAPSLTLGNHTSMNVELGIEYPR